MNIYSLHLACSTCAEAFKHGDNSKNAVGWSIFFMLVVILCILGGIGVCLFRIARREKETLDPKYKDDFQPQSISAH